MALGKEYMAQDAFQKVHFSRIEDELEVGLEGFAITREEVSKYLT